MTVNYIRNLKRTMAHSIDDYENGYRQCSEEMWKLIHAAPNLIPEQRDRLATRCRQMWSNRRSLHHPYQRPISNNINLPSNLEHYPSQSSTALKILINHQSISNIHPSCSSSSSASSNSLSPSSPKLWKPYM